MFLVATLPNLLFGPIAGGLVDRWDHREVMIVSDLLRAGLVLLIPLAAVTNLVLAYPIVFLVTTVSIFFRPAKGAILPRIVAQDDLVPANSALWVGETFADIFGYVIAGLFVALLGSQLPLAFWVDSVTYIASAVLIASISVAPVARVAAEKARGLVGSFRELGGEIREGWRFLRGEAVLMANTLQATAGQAMLGILLALTPIYAASLIDTTGLTEEVADRLTTEAYGFLEGAIGAGNLIGGFIIGLIGSRLALGKMVIVGYVATGAMVAALALAGNLPAALAIMFGVGVANLAFVIPSQTLFQRRTPPEMMGRVLGLPVLARRRRRRRSRWASAASSASCSGRRSSSGPSGWSRWRPAWPACSCRPFATPEDAGLRYTAPAARSGRAHGDASPAMTERSNDAPEDDLEPTRSMPAAGEPPEAATEAVAGDEARSRRAEDGGSDRGGRRGRGSAQLRSARGGRGGTRGRAPRSRSAVRRGSRVEEPARAEAAPSRTPPSRKPRSRKRGRGSRGEEAAPAEESLSPTSRPSATRSPRRRGT